MPKWQAELYSRLRHARITGDPVTLAYMEDDKDFVGVYYVNATGGVTVLTSLDYPAPTGRSLVPIAPDRIARQRVGRVHIHRPVLFQGCQLCRFILIESPIIVRIHTVFSSTPNTTAEQHEQSDVILQTRRRGSWKDGQCV
jgi:hypothetical protein